MQVNPAFALSTFKIDTSNIVPSLCLFEPDADIKFLSKQSHLLLFMAAAQALGVVSLQDGAFGKMGDRRRKYARCIGIYVIVLGVCVW